MTACGISFPPEAISQTRMLWHRRIESASGYCWRLIATMRCLGDIRAGQNTGHGQSISGAAGDHSHDFKFLNDSLSIKRDLQVQRHGD